MIVNSFLGKPKSLEWYLEDFISDMKALYNEGISIKGKTIAIRIRSFICDTPARAFVKSITFLSYRSK